MARKRWNESSPRTRQVLRIAASVEVVLKVTALLDLLKRPAAELVGS